MIGGEAHQGTEASKNKQIPQLRKKEKHDHQRSNRCPLS